MYSTIYNKDKAKRLPHSTFDVERSMFDVQIVASKITTKPSYNETFEKRPNLFKAKEDENFKRRNTLSILRIKI
jgi:hypothetical protein